MIKLFNLFQQFRHNRKTHWEKVYKKKTSNELSWYQDCPEVSLRLITSTRLGAECNIIDVGGGTSKLADFLLQQGYKNLTVLDISGSSIKKSRLRLGNKASKIKWIEADITNFNLEEKYDIWHDRAVFHFLTDSQDRKKYISALRRALKPDGHVIIATFSLSGPQKCSGLKIVRYSPESLHDELGNNFQMIEALDEVHLTPTKVKQNFIYCRLKKKA